MKSLLYLLFFLLFEKLASPETGIFIFTFVVFIPFFYVIETQKKFILPLFYFSFFYCCLYFSWIIKPFEYTNLSPILSFLIYLLFSFILSIFLIVFGFYFKKNSEHFFKVSIFFVFLEILKGNIFTGFPWGDLSYNLYNTTFLIQIASFFGSYSVTFFVILINLLIYNFLKTRKTKALIFVILVIFLFIFSNFFSKNITKNFLKGGEKIKVLIVQANIPEQIKMNEKNALFVLDRYINQTLKSDLNGVDLIIWPESVYLKFFEEDKKLKSKFKNFLLNHLSKNQKLILGMPSINFYYSSFSKKYKYKIYNSLYIFFDNGKKFLKYDKIHLVPFGEYTPYKHIFSFVNKIVPGEDFSSGINLKILEFKRLKIIPLICYEGIFQKLLLQFAKKGGNLIVNISNEAWFGNSKALYQHLAANVLRTVEFGKFFLKSANTGISAVISPDGVILEKIAPEKKSNIIKEINLVNKKTFFVKKGYIINYLFLFTGLYILVLWIWSELRDKFRKKSL